MVSRSEHLELASSRSALGLEFAASRLSRSALWVSLVCLLEQELVDLRLRLMIFSSDCSEIDLLEAVCEDREIERSLA